MPQQYSLPSREEVERKILCSLTMLRQNDSFLLTNDVNERTISHQLAVYLKQHFSDWDVDCEYNRIRDVAKSLVIPKCLQPNLEDTEAKTVFPDIIIHHRNTDDNLAVIEIKKTTNNDTGDFDKLKLKAFKQQLNYIHCFFLKLRTLREDCGVASLEYLNGHSWEEIRLTECL